MASLLITVVIGTLGFFFLGMWLALKAQSSFQVVLLVLAGLLLAAPAILFDVYYTGIFGEADWFYSLRAMPGSELAACGLGLLAGWFQTKRSQNQRVSKRMSAGFIPFILLLSVLIPYLKPLLLRPDWNTFDDRWSDGVCLQSSESSCGPASAATLLKFFGRAATEKQLAQESHTSRRGTENWYLIRTLRQHGLEAQYHVGKSNEVDLTYPSIVGVRLGGRTGSGHFIAILGRSGDDFITGDPLVGRVKLSQAQLLDRYYFTGFAIVVAANPP